ncbi:MAG: glycosyltransferase family 2 protein, partial [Anaerolineae bacterium]|nr:glycosyltransferase family 2 protein [Anaerolineae bacterium]
MNSKVSVIIPCYNASHWIRDTIDSCLKQSYQSIEIIVVDDGSTDDSLTVIRSYGDRVKCLAGPNEGGCRARNLGFQQSEGEYVMFLDADDVIDPAAISLLVEALGSGQYDIAACDWRYLRERRNGWL